MRFMPASTAASDLRAQPRTAAATGGDRPSPSGRPLELPQLVELAELKLSLDFLRSTMEDRQNFRNNTVIDNDQPDSKAGFSQPGVGHLLGTRLAATMGAFLSRPSCVYSDSFIWRFGRGGAMAQHTDRMPLDITMSIPLTLDGVDAWPMGVRQPNGDVWEWGSQPGTACIFDGKWRPHWRKTFAGERAILLLLHWRAPAVLWSGMLTADVRARLCADRGSRSAIGPLVLERCADLAGLAIPGSGEPELSLCDRRLRTLPERAGRKDTHLLVLLQGELTVALDAVAPVVLTSGDGISFPAEEKCRLDWTAPDGCGLALLGHAQKPRRRRS